MLDCSRRLVAALALGAGLAMLPADRAQADLGSAPAKAAPRPPQPGTGDDDWVQMNSGEWLRGEIKDLLDDTLVFDSEEFDELTLDMDDVYAIYSNRTNTLGFRDRTIVEGAVRIEGESVEIASTGGETVVRTRGELRSVVPDRRREVNLWSGKLSLGASIRSGNVDQTDISGFALVQRRDVYTRLALQYDGAYGEVDGDKTVNNHRGTANYDWFFAENLYWRVAGFTGFSDEFQNIEYRLVPGTGLGYTIIDDGRLDWDALGGLGWEHVKYFDPAPGQPDTSDSAAFLGATRFSWEATSKIDLGIEFDITVPFDSANTYNFRAVLWSSVELWGDLDLDARLIWDHQNDPVPNADGTVPDPDDYRLYLGVGWSF